MKILKCLALGITVSILCVIYIGLGLAVRNLAYAIADQERTLNNFFCAECASIPLFEEDLRKAEVVYSTYQQLDEKCKTNRTIKRAEIHAELALLRAQRNLKRGKEACVRAKDCD